ncbi:hypothetical protein FF1_018671 [Malus domestica]
MFTYWRPSFSTCSWPHLNRTLSSTADPDYVTERLCQICLWPHLPAAHGPDLPLPPKSLALDLAQFFIDLCIRRAFHQSVLPLWPDVVFFLGDYFDGDPHLLDEEWSESLSRLGHIFSLRLPDRYLNTPVYYLPGNHDIGYGSLHSRN